MEKKFGQEKMVSILLSYCIEEEEMPIITASVVILLTVSGLLLKYIHAKSLQTPQKIPSKRMERKKTNEECPICLEFIMFMDRVSDLDCGHDFHYSCIKKVEIRICPLCRTIF